MKGQLMHTTLNYRYSFSGIVLLVIAVWFCAACSSPSAPATNTPLPTRVPATDTPKPTLVPTLTPTPRVTLTPTITPSPTPDPSCAPGSLADTAVNRDVDLLYQPDGNPIGAPRVTKGRCVILFGKDDRTDTSKKWYRVLWADFVGWIPAEATGFPEKKLDLLRTPPPCAKPRAITQGMSTEWTSNYDGQIVAVIDLYRAKLGTDYPTSTFQIKVNGTPVAGKDRIVSSKGQYLMRATPLGVNVRQGNKIGFTLKTGSQEPVKLFATYFSVPNGCNFDDRP